MTGGFSAPTPPPFVYLVCRVCGGGNGVTRVIHENGTAFLRRVCADCGALGPFVSPSPPSTESERA